MVLPLVTGKQVAGSSQDSAPKTKPRRYGDRSRQVGEIRSRVPKAENLEHFSGGGGFPNIYV